jgi:hypothetical protein
VEKSRGLDLFGESAGEKRGDAGSGGWVRGIEAARSTGFLPSRCRPWSSSRSRIPSRATFTAPTSYRPQHERGWSSPVVTGLPNDILHTATATKSYGTAFVSLAPASAYPGGFAYHAPIE